MKIQQITETAVSKTNRSRNEIGYKNWNEIQRAVRHSSSNPSDPRHSARLTIDGREVVISKQSAEQLFRWLKKNFKTKHERELYDFLAHQRLLGVLDDKPVISELAPSKPGDNGGDEDFDEDTLKQYAAQWWRGNDAQQKKIERTLHFSSYEIGHDEGYDNGGVFVIRVGDTHGSSYLSWSAEDLEQLNEFVQGDDDRDNRPERPLSLADVAKIIKARLGSDWTMQHVGRTEQPGYKFITTDKTKHGMAKIWCLVDWNKVGEYPTYNTILFAYERKDGKIIANGRQTERAKSKTVANALETARLILNNKGGLKDVVAEGDYSDEEIERYGPELIQRQRNLDLLASVFGYQNIHRVARALRAGNLKRRLRHNEGTPEERAQYSRAVRILDSMTDESGNIMPHTDTTVYRQK